MVIISFVMAITLGLNPSTVIRYGQGHGKSSPCPGNPTPLKWIRKYNTMQCKAETKLKVKVEGKTNASKICTGLNESHHH